MKSEQNPQNPDLSEEQKRVLFNKMTEYPGTGRFLHHNEQGDYTCANCGAKLFNSTAKYDSTIPGLMGWPSFDKAIEGAIEEKPDNSFGMSRTEITCANCGGHLGHVFAADDAPSGIHYCVNSVSLGFEKDKV